MKWLVVFVLMGISSQATALTVSVFTSTSKTVVLQWTKVTGATSYEITVAPKTSLSNPIAFVTYGPNTVMGSIGPLSPEILYEFTIKALNGFKQILDTSSFESQTAPDMMDPIQDVKAKDSKTLMASFSLMTGATSYIIQIQNANGFYREDTVSTSPAEITLLTPYTEYTLSILAVNSVGRGQPSSPVTAKTVLSPPEISSTSSPTNESIIVSWTPVAHAVQYTMFIYKLGSSSQMNYNTSNTNLTVSGLDAGSIYVIKCYGWDPEGRQGESSPYVHQTTRPPTPSSVIVSMVTTGPGLSVSWERKVNASIEYHVWSDHNLTCTTTSNNCILLPVACGEVYTIQVNAWNEAGPSYPSSPVVFITYPCPPESLVIVESEGNCTLTWDTVPHAESYTAFIKKSDGSEEICNTTGSNCTYRCLCGYTFYMSVFAFNQAGSSPQGPVLSHTTLPCCPEGVSVLTVSTDTLEIMWKASRGADLYETRAVDSTEVILCNDTEPVCALSDLTCDSSYSVIVTPCNDISGCNRACQAHTKDTAACQPMNLKLNLKNSTCVTVSWTASNRAATYNVTASGPDGVSTCSTSGNSCDITNLPCGSTYKVTAIAISSAGQSLPSYSESLETEPCCPVNLELGQVTQAMTNVSWSHAKGAHSFITSLTSVHGHARCHTQDYHCLMGCITCGTNYTVTMEAYSLSGRMSNCTYQGFSSSACCPSGVRLYSRDNNTMQVYWRSGGSNHTYIAGMVGTNNNYTCTASPGENSCDIKNVQCGEVYNVTVAPLTPGGSKVNFCSQRQYSVTCLGNNVGVEAREVWTSNTPNSSIFLILLLLHHPYP